MIHTGDTDLFDIEWELKCSSSILPAVNIEPLGVRASASHVMTKFGSWGGGYKADFLRSVIFPIFHNNQNNGYLYDITFLFDRCHRSWAAETPDKYEHGWKYLTYTFAKSKFPIIDKLTTGALVTPPLYRTGFNDIYQSSARACKFIC